MQVVRNIFLAVMVVFMTLALSGSTVVAHEDGHDLPGHSTITAVADAYTTGKCYQVDSELNLVMYQEQYHRTNTGTVMISQLPGGSMFKVTLNNRGTPELNRYAAVTRITDIGVAYDNGAGFVREATFGSVTEIRCPRIPVQAWGEYQNSHSN